MKGYEFVKSKFDEIGVLGEISSIMHWDSNVIMPKKSSEFRGHQLAYLSERMHIVATDPHVLENLEIAKSEIYNLDNIEQANLKLIERHVRKANVLSPQLVAKITMAANDCEMIWRTAKVEDNFKLVAPSLQKLIELVKEEAALKADLLGVTPYNALLDEYDYGRTTDELDILFKDLKSFLIGFSNKVIDGQKKVTCIKRNYPKKLQNKIFKQYLKMLNFDFEAGRLDKSVHPFCGGIPSDSRITTWYQKNNFISGIYAVVHEGGHSLYERNLPKKYRLQPVGRACGFAIHESQSLFMEKQIGMNDNFIKNLYDKTVETFGYSDLSLEEFKYSIEKVERSFIRVDADEVTYPLHVIMRYEIEKDLISGALKVVDLPQRWNSDMKEMLGITPPTNTLGCLQDIHWYSGCFGYFPAYTIGALTAAQIMVSIKDVIPNVDELIRVNNLQPIIEWLNINIHNHGSLYSPSELIKLATGSKLDAIHYKNYLSDRYDAGSNLK